MSSTKPPLYPSQEKVRFAKSEFKNLVSEIRFFIKNNPPNIRIEVNSDGSSTAFLKSPDEIPAGISIRASSIVKQLREALDKMVVALVDANGRGHSGVSFPFGGKNIETGKIEEFPTGRHNSIKKKLTPKQWRLILAQKPYPSGNDLLWAINQIANTDKHRMDLVGVRPDFKQGFAMGNGYLSSFVSHEEEVFTSENGAELKIFTIGAGTTMNIEHSVSTFVSFFEIEPVNGKNVLVTLNQQIRMVDHILKTFKAAFFT